MPQKSATTTKVEDTRSKAHHPLKHCQRMLGVFSDYLDRKSKIRICRKIEEHLRACPDCRFYVDTLRKTVVLYRSLGQEPVPDDVQQRLFATIRLKQFLKKRVGGNTLPRLQPKRKTVARRRRR